MTNEKRERGRGGDGERGRSVKICEISGKNTTPCDPVKNSV